MFSQGQGIFALIFVVAFTLALILMYRRDAVLHKAFYKGSYKILIGFLIFIALLFAMKFVLKQA